MSSALLPRDLVGVGVGVGAVWDYPPESLVRQGNLSSIVDGVLNLPLLRLKLKGNAAINEPEPRV